MRQKWSFINNDFIISEKCPMNSNNSLDYELFKRMVKKKFLTDCEYP